MYAAMDRPQPWAQPQSHHQPHLDRASPQSQPGWFPLQNQSPHAGWGPEAGRPVEYAADHAYGSSPTTGMYTAPAYSWTDDQSQPAARPVPSYRPMTPYPRRAGPPDFYAPQSQPRGYDPQQQAQPRRRAKEIAIGRWNSEEHKWFLKGLETFQGPAWGEIARFIGTRTSTQVRTHAQKFFTKLARLNQTLPYFEVQIQKERMRLLAQGASVTPTAASTLNYSSATLSPRKRVAATSSVESVNGANGVNGCSGGGGSPRQTLKRHREAMAATHGYSDTAPEYVAVKADYRNPKSEFANPATGSSYDAAVGTQCSPSAAGVGRYAHAAAESEVYYADELPQYEYARGHIGASGMASMRCKPRVCTSDVQESMSAPMPTLCESNARVEPREWRQLGDDGSARLWQAETQPQQQPQAMGLPESEVVDAESLPSMSKLLYRSAS